MTTHEWLQSAIGDAYVIERELTGGGMSRVFVAEERALGRKVVVKVLPREMAAHVSSERFQREITLAARLQHPHIVPLLAAGDANGQPYFTMPFVRGESLRAQIAQRGELPINEAVRVLREIASALAFAHADGVVHRDIKPENVLLSGGSAMVTDFGVAKAVDNAHVSDGRKPDGSLTSLGIALGTPAYMSPEQATASPNVDHRADIYSWGVLAYELITGNIPFAGRAPQAQLAAHVTEEPESIAKRRDTVPPALATLVMRCLAKRAADRPQSASEIVSALDAIGTPSGGMSPATAVQPANPKSSRRRTVMAAVTVVVLGISGWLYASGSAQVSSALTSVAVLPFENIGGDTAVEYLADGISEGLRSALRESGLRVTASASSAAYKGQPVDPQAVTRSLGVNTLLIGRVQHFGTRIRVTAELVNGDGFQIWDERIDAQATDAFALQDQILARITSALRSNLRLGSSSRTSHTPSARAYDLYMRGRHARNTFSREGLERAVALLKESIAQDSLYAPAHAELGYAYLNLADGYDPPTTTVPLARVAVMRALALDERNAPAHFLLGAIMQQYDYDWSGSEREFRRALQLDPNNADVHWVSAFNALMRGERERAISEYRTGLQLDPLSPLALNFGTFFYAVAGLPDSAIALHKRAQEVAPDFMYAEAWAGFAFRMKGDVQGAFTLDTAAARIVGRPTLGLITDLARLGRRDEARARTLDLERRFNSGVEYVPPEMIAFAWLELGDVERGMTYFEKGAEMRSGFAQFIAFFARFYRMPTQNPRFVAYLGRLRMDSNFRPLE